MLSVRAYYNSSVATKSLAYCSSGHLHSLSSPDHAVPYYLKTIAVPSWDVLKANNELKY
jgi:hypothetical protein